MLHRLRDNMFFKIVSLVAAILLWGYVQVEHTGTRALYARVSLQNAPASVDSKTVPTQVPVSVTGPRSVVDRLKDGDIVAEGSLHMLKSDVNGTTMVKLHPVLPDFARGIAIDPIPSIKVRITTQQQTQITVTPIFPKEPPPGFHYTHPVVEPRVVTVTGTPDRLNQLDRVVVNAIPPEPGASVDNDFPVWVRDSDNSPVDGVVVEPDHVHVSITLAEEPSVKVVTVSASIVDQPQPPHLLSGISITPNQVRVVGRPERLNELFTVRTDDIRLSTATADGDYTTNLVLPPGTHAEDIAGRRISRVTVHVKLKKSAAAGTAVP